MSNINTLALLAIAEAAMQNAEDLISDRTPELEMMERGKLLYEMMGGLPNEVIDDETRKKGDEIFGEGGDYDRVKNVISRAKRVVSEISELLADFDIEPVSEEEFSDKYPNIVSTLRNSSYIKGV